MNDFQHPPPEPSRKVHGTEILATDTRQQYREKIARITLDSMVQFVGLLDAHGTVLEINKVALDAVGIKLSDVEGRPFWTTFWWQVSPEINQGIRDAIARAAQGEFVRWDTPIYGRAGGSETIIIDASVMPVKDDHGNVVFLACEGRDITEKKAQEAEIARKNVELQGLLERIRELDEIKTQFFANVSHELRTPLALIIGPAERLQNPELGLTRESQVETAQVIARNARMLLKHVNDLLDISKLEAGGLKIALQTTDVAALVRFIASHFDILAAERDVCLSVQTPASLFVAVDPAKLQRVVMNLLSNAFKFVGPGGQVRVQVAIQDDRLAVSVDDSGPGVKPELRKAIFERFRQGDGGTNRQASGTGLGLAIAHEFVELHEGTIDVSDSDLGGARFEALLPLIRASAEDSTAADVVHDRGTLEGLIEELRLPSASAARAPASEPRLDGGMRAKVLVIEDNADMNRFVAQCLAAEYEVVTAFDGQQGLERALAVRPDLIVSDIMMPVVSGEQMVYALRRHPEMEGTPILLLSAKADEELKNRLLSDGAQDFVTKPFTERDLLVRARNLVETKRLREVAQTAANRLGAQNKHLGELFEQAPGFMAVLRGPDHVFELANAAYFKLIGARDILGKPIAEALPEVREQGFIDLLDRVLATGERYVGSAVPVQLQRGAGGPDVRYVDFVYQPLLDDAGRLSGVFVQGHDVTDRKQAEDALRAADRRKDEFLATLAHELRNPLAPIRHAARISKTPSATDAQLKWSHDVIDRQVDHMSRLLDDLLEVSRITRGKLELRKERIDLGESIAAAVGTARPLIEARGHSLAVELPRSRVEIDADPVRFAQILSNLLTNAAKYTDPGGRIRVEACVRDGNAVISVQDNGIGIAPELQPQVFEMFSQATSALDRSEGGLGIGLSLTHGLVALHGGTVAVRSAGLGRGSEFVVTLPVAHAAPSLRGDDRAARSSATESARKQVRVLVADDNRDSADSSATLLQLDGHDVRVAYSGVDALRLVEEFAPQLALLDIGMPGMNGYELARRIRATERGRSILLVAVTGWGQEEDKRLAEAAGFDEHRAKPVDFSSLQDLIARCAEQAW